MSIKDDHKQLIEPWLNRWKEKRTGWDLGGVHPFLPKLYKGLKQISPHLQTSAKVYVPGCGRGHDVVYFAQLGYQVEGADVSDIAILEARKLYHAQNNVKFSIADSLEQPISMGDFDIVYDRAMLCALGETYRQTYIDACAARLKSGGFFLSIPFTKVQLPDGRLDGPPYAVSRDQLFQYFERDYNLLLIEDQSIPSLDGVIVSEALIIFRKR